MIKLVNIALREMVNIKTLSFTALAIFALTGVVVASGHTPYSGFNTLQLKQVSSQNAIFVEAEVLVKFKSNVPTQAQQHTASNLGGSSFAPVGKKLRVARIKLPPGSDVLAAVQAFQADANVEHAQPNYIYRASAIPNDANYNQLWGMNNTGQTISNSTYAINNPGISGNDIDAESAWDQITDCRSVIVAVLDTGINYTHQDLAGNLWDGSASGFPNHGYDYFEGDDDPMPTTGSEDHGTHVSGTIGAQGNNGGGVSGVCWRATIMTVRVLGPNGGFTSDIISGIEFAADNGAGVINMSLGGENPFDSLFSAAIDYALGLDVVVVVAAGNDGVDNDGVGADLDPGTETYPCNFTQANLVCVAALDQAYSLASFSNFGPTSVDVGAPGTNTLSSFAGQQITDDFTSGWTLTGGWASASCLGLDLLTNPLNWCSFGSYNNNLDARAYKSFNLGGAVTTDLNYYAGYDTEFGFDIFNSAMIGGTGDPFAGGGTPLQSDSGSTFGFLFGMNYDITSCSTANCSVGFQLDTDPGTVDLGVAITFFTIDSLQINSTNYAAINGTSMASPHVAGIATMVRAFNPNYSYVQTVDALLNGGEVVAALSGSTTTGRSANAMGAIAYITEPTGFTGGIQ